MHIYPISLNLDLKQRRDVAITSWRFWWRSIPSSRTTKLISYFVCARRKVLLFLYSPFFLRCAIWEKERGTSGRWAYTAMLGHPLSVTLDTRLSFEDKCIFVISGAYFCLTFLSFIHQWPYSPLLGSSLFFSSVIFYTQTVGLLGQVISPS
jgi:hypothetical protein